MKLYFRQGQEWQSRETVRAHTGGNTRWWAPWTLSQSMAVLLGVPQSELIVTTGGTEYLNWVTYASATAPDPTEKVRLGASFNWCCSDLGEAGWCHCQVTVGHRQDHLPFTDHLHVLETLLLLCWHLLYRMRLPVDETRNPQHGSFPLQWACPGGESRSAWRALTECCQGCVCQLAQSTLQQGTRVQAHSWCWDQLLFNTASEEESFCNSPDLSQPWSNT